LGKLHQHSYSCFRKVKYPSEAAAWIPVHKLRGITPYKCLQCGEWHLDHSRLTRPSFDEYAGVNLDRHLHITLILVEEGWKLWQKAMGYYEPEPGYDVRTGHYVDNDLVSV
jgi:hypothetical protein